MKRIDYRAGIFFSLVGIPGAILGALTTYYVPREVFHAVCGMAMLLAAGYLLWQPAPHQNPEPQEIPEEAAPRISFNLPLGALISACVGYVSSLLGIGGGIIHVPALIRVLNFPVHVATATSHFILAVMALTGTVVHVASGAFHVGFRRTFFLAIGVVAGAQVGAALSRHVRGPWIIRALAIALALVALRLLL